jgi:hypothetical protein
MEHSSSRAICSKVSHKTSRHWKVRALFLFGSALMRGPHFFSSFFVAASVLAAASFFACSARSAIAGWTQCLT